ncbi:hypothetical protein PSACC_03383 [Paramicrosporidium saccamoebae]|uniref:Uncharacterized protein n=1 Tax=Paramicrosporidium saccamoebae TaxID=1246581 RepID=A0A2H9TGE9_9FUNG|nr:hypothetical protein PSACC_03383 [Paramicrosporidium saccamoebae]
MVQCSLPENLATALDVPHFAQLLTLLNEENAQFEMIVGEHQRHLEQFWQLRLLKNALSNGNSRSVNIAQAQQDFPFLDIEQSTMTANQASQGIEQLVAPLIQTGQLLFPSIPVHSTSTLLQSVQLAQRQIQECTDEFRSKLDDILASLVDSTKKLHQVEEACQKIVLGAEPVAVRYLGTFSIYIRAVIESLDLKLQ